MRAGELPRRRTPPARLLPGEEQALSRTYREQHVRHGGTAFETSLSEVRTVCTRPLTMPPASTDARPSRAARHPYGGTPVRRSAPAASVVRVPSDRLSVPRRSRPRGRAYGADVSERSPCSCYSSDHSYERGGWPPRRDPLSPPCQAWKLRGYGTGAGPPQAAGARAPWFAVGVSRADGTQVEVVAAVVDGRVHLEEVRADPPLSPQAFAKLAPCLGEPLTRACPSAIRPPQTAPTVRATGACVLPPVPRAAGPQPSVSTLPPAPPFPHPPSGSQQRCPSVAPPPPASRQPSDAPQPSTPVRPPESRHPESPHPPVRGRRRPPAPRGRAALRVAAEAYTAARERGQDPVLAVMRVTGRSRRKSLRVIASARDAGLLSPRHARR
ncbi:DUF6214 family protein [Streptomyces smyrnaeus]|uniref:DUF6214 family protein n=2 Tax=Streptomyces smyrnaeus TaxID=1387713 RepID=UPI0033D7234C